VDHHFFDGIEKMMIVIKMKNTAAATVSGFILTAAFTTVNTAFIAAKIFIVFFIFSPPSSK